MGAYYSNLSSMSRMPMGRYAEQQFEQSPEDPTLPNANPGVMTAPSPDQSLTPSGMPPAGPSSPPPDNRYYNPNLSPTQPWGQSGIPFTWDGNQGDLWQNQWQRQAMMGSRMMGELEQNQNQYNQAEAGYSNLVPNLYSDIWNNRNGGGGFTPQMQSDIVQREGLDQITGNLDSGYLAGGEQRGMMGDPYGAYNLSRPYQSDIASTAQQTGQQQLAALPYLQRQQQLAARQQNQNLNSLAGTEQGVQGNQRQVVGGLAGQQDASLANMRSGYGAAINPDRLRSDPSLGSDVRGMLGQGLEYVNDPNFKLRDDYLAKAGITDAEVNQLAASAGADASAPYQADRDRFYRMAIASGNVNPLGIAAKAQEFDRGAAGDAADAMNKARMNARMAQIQSLQGIQNTALGAAGARAGAGLNLIGTGAGALSDVERLRMGGEQDLSSRLINANENLTQQDIDNARYAANLRMGVNQQDTANAQDLASRYSGTVQQGVQNQQYLTGQQTGLTGEAGNRNIGAYQYNANLGTGLASAADQAAAQRAAALATNRQSTNQFNTGVNLAANNALSQRYTAAYNPWLTAQQEGRQAATGQQGYFGGRAQDTTQSRLGTYNEQVQGGNQTLGGYTNWASVDKQPGKVANAFNTAASFF